MGAGKTTIGRHLAKALGMTFYDSDREIEARTGATISLIFELEGEEGFRQREEKVIDELTQKQGIVLATGGGAVLREANRLHLKERGQVVYLSATIDQILDRTRHDKSRPLLQTDDPRARLEEIITKRDPLYRECADVIMKTGTRSVRNMVKEVLTKLDLKPAKRPQTAS